VKRESREQGRAGGPGRAREGSSNVMSFVIVTGVRIGKLASRKLNGTGIRS
jgi:hypothetical protein